MRQVHSNTKLVKVNLPALTTVGGDFLVRARPRRARLIAPAAARITPSLPCCRASARPRVRQVNGIAKLAKLELVNLETVKGDLLVRAASPALG